MKYFLDTYALIEIAEGNPGYKKYLATDAVTLKENLAELFYFVLRKYDEKAALGIFNIYSKIALDLPLEIIPRSMKFRYTNKNKNFSYVDCLGYSFSVENQLQFLTGDRAFSEMDNVVIVR